MASNKQTIATLRAELNERQAKAEAAQRNVNDLQQRIRQLRGAMLLDSDIDHTPRIATAETELKEAQTYLADFPLAAEELRRRITEIEQSIAAERLAGDAERYQELTTTEAAQRREFAQAVVQLATVAKSLLATIAERQALYAIVHPAALPMPVGGRPSNHLPPVRVEWFTAGAVEDAQRTLANELS